MTLRVLFVCNGTRPGAGGVPGRVDRCEAWLPLPADWTPVTQLLDPDAAVNRAWAAGWTRTPAGADLCPACTQAARFRDLAEQATRLPLAPLPEGLLP